MKQRIGIVLTVFLLFFSLVGCQGRSVSPFSYLATDFCATLRGSMGKRSFSCELTVRAEGLGRRVVLEYSAPGELSGLSLSVLQGKDGALGEATVSKDGLTLALPAPCVEGLLAPATVILAEREPVSLQKRKEGTLFVRFDGGELVLGENGSPLELSAEGLALVIDRWARLGRG